MADLLFYVLGGVTLGTAALTVLSRNAVNSAMFFLLSLLATAGLFVLLDAYLLAALLVLVYAGAVVALFLFIIMLLDMQGGVRPPFTRATIAAAVAATGLLTVGVLSFVHRAQLSALLPVQVVGFLLLIAMLGVIVLSKRFEGLEDIK
jgi:NADH-quinone oxidoreductase subunit J